MPNKITLTAAEGSTWSLPADWDSKPKTIILIGEGGSERKDRDPRVCGGGGMSTTEK